jgi:hypothetical protein
MNHSRKDVAMMGAIGGLLAFAVFNFAFKPQSKELGARRSDRRSVEKEIAVVQAELQAPVDTTPAGTSHGLSPAAIPEDPAITELLRELQALADPLRVTLETITPTELERNPSGPGGSLAVEITAAGAPAANESFVRGLQGLDRLLVVEKITVVTPPPVAGEPTPPEQLQLTARVFTLRAPVEAAEETPTTGP